MVLEVIETESHLLSENIYLIRAERLKTTAVSFAHNLADQKN